MKLSLKQPNTFSLQGSGQEFRMIASYLLQQNNESISFMENLKIREFYQSLLHASSKDITESLEVIANKECLIWLFHALHILSQMTGKKEDWIEELDYQFRLLQKNNDETEPNSLKDKLMINYQDIIGVKNIQKMVAFMESFQITEDELQQMIVTSFIEAYPTVQVKEIRIDMLERMYHYFFEKYQSLLIETHLIYTFPEFKEQLIQLYNQERKTDNDFPNTFFIGIYLLHFDMFLKGMEDGFVYQAEDKEMLFEWFQSLFIQVANEYQKPISMKDREEERIEKDMLEFREIYIQELAKSFSNIERIESDKDIPYNVVFVLKDKQKIVTNTLKHYQWYVQEEIKGYGKERVKSIKEFIKKIAPLQNNKTTIDVIKKPFEDIKDNLYPMIRMVESSPKEAVFTPFVQGLGIYYGIQMKEKGKTQYAIIMKSLMENWNTDIGVIHQTALENLSKRNPKFVTYYEVMEKKLNQQQLRSLPQAYQELYMYAGKSAIDSSYLLNKEAIKELKMKINTDSLILSMPLRDCLLVTTKEHLSFLKKLTTQLYEASSSKLLSHVMIESNGEWVILE